MGAPYALSSDLVSAWPAKSLEVAQYIDGQLPLIAMTQNAQTGTTYTLAATDFTKLVTLSNASPVTVTVPLESSVAWVAGTQLRLMNLGAGVVTVVGAGGVTINGSPLTLAQFKEGTLTKTGTNTWTFTGSASAPGMDLITPTSVAGSGVTLSGGEVTFSAATSVSLNGCFTSAYQNYRLVLSLTANSAGSTTYIRLRASGSDTSTSTYGYVFSRQASTVNDVQGGTTTAWALLYSDATKPSQGIVDLFRSNSSGNAGMRGQTFSNDTVFIQYSVGGLCSQATTHDGFSVYPNTGNITGTLRVYGLRNS